jgi:hypothetical protein
MKNKSYLFTFAAAIALALVFTGSCKEDEQTDLPILQVDKTTITATQAAGTYAIAVTANVAWAAVASQPFVTPTPASGTGNATINITVTANEGLDVRNATIIVSANGVESKTITVTQPGTSPMLTVSPETLTFPADGNDQAVAITANVAWTATVTGADGGEVDWLSVDPAEGTTSAELTITAGANIEMARAATITFSATGVTPQTIAVTQDGVTLEVSKTSIAIDADGIRRLGQDSNIYDTITVTSSNAGWTIQITTLPADNPALAPAHTDSHEWVWAKKEDNLLIYAIDANPYPRARAATITVNGLIDIAVTQSAREHLYVGGEVVGGAWEGGASSLTETAPGSGVYEIDRAFSAGIFKLPLIDGRPTAFFAAGTADEVLETDGTEHDLYLVPLTTDWSNGALDQKWKITSGNAYKLTVNLNTMKLKLEPGTPVVDPEAELINGVVWAKRNVDDPGTFAATPQDAGKYYQFLGNVGYPATGGSWPGPNGVMSPVDQGWYDAPHTANDPCPSGWKVPREGDFSNLKNTGYKWRAAGSSAGNTVAGMFFGPNANDATISNPGNAIFIPAAGRRKPADGALEYSGTQGWVHTGNPYYGQSSQIVVIRNITGSQAGNWENWLNRQSSSANANWGTGANVRCIKN